jgi:oligosaccharide reducing-end xylanase
MLRDIFLRSAVTAISLAGAFAVAAPNGAAQQIEPGSVRTASASTASTTATDDGAGAYRSKRYRNLFAERLGRSPDEVHRRIEQTFQQLFHGDGQEQRVYFETGANANGTLAYVTDWANNDARTEGMSYGMMIAVQLNKKREFDALWNWSKTYMLTTDPANPSRGYFAWSMGTDGSARAVGAAPDGEEYYVMALYFAARRWGNGTGIYNYQLEADNILRGMRHHPPVTATPPFRIHPGDAPFVQPDTPWPSPNNRHEQERAAKEGKPWPPRWPKRPPQPVTVGPMVDEASNMIRFVPETAIPGSDPSYHLPAFYELWARWAPPEERPFWARAARVSRDYFVKTAHPKTGLGPDRATFDGTPLPMWDGSPGIFAYDSWRTVSNWSVDYSWWGRDAREPELAERVQAFLNAQGIDRFVDRYTLDGQPKSDRHSTGMLAAAAVAGLAAKPGPVPDAFLRALWDTPVPSGEQRYFDGMLYLMSMMHLGGEFRVIDRRSNENDSE